MKWVTGTNWGISTKQLLDKMNWLSIYQLAIYHSVLLLWKIKKYEEASHTIEILQKSEKSKPRIDLTSRIWSRKASYYYYKLGDDVRKQNKISTFKKSLKTWIKTNVPVSEELEDPGPRAC